MNKRVYILNHVLLIVILLLSILSSCKKYNEDVNYREPYNFNSNYIYNSISEYYNKEGKLEKVFNSEGELLFLNDEIYLMPKQGNGTEYTISSSEIVANDTVAFMMPNNSMREIYYNSQFYTLYYIDGVADIKVGNYGFYDGYYTNKDLIFKFKSTNTHTDNWVITKVIAKKK